MGRRWLAFGVTAVALVAAGCGGGGGEAAEPPPTEPPVSEAAPTTTVRSEEDAVLAAYQGYWSALLRLGGLAPDGPALGDYATGGALARSTAALVNQRAVGQYVALPDRAKYEHRAVVEALDGDSAVVRDCAVDDGLLLAIGSGTVIDDSVSTRLLTAELVRSQREWLVAEVIVVQQWDGVAGCAA